MPENFQYDVFLSHNSADKPRVRRLAERLRAAGGRVWFDEWVIQPGDDIYLAIERGLEAARTLVLCLSSAALGSDWVGLERSTVLFRDPANAGPCFIPASWPTANSRTRCRGPSRQRKRFRQQTRLACNEEITGRRLQTPLAAAHQDGHCGDGEVEKLFGNASDNRHRPS